MSFTHLHVHTEYSLLDGASRIRPLVDRASELGMDSLAITDHGVMFGVVDFYEAAKAKGIKPLIGCEVYTARRTRFDRDPEKDKGPGHLILIAENQEGYNNLIKIVSAAFTEGFYYKPRVDNDLLRMHRGGIIATSACLAGRVQQALLNGDYEGAKREALEYDDIFGHGNFFLEIQDQGLEEEARIREDIIRLSRETGIGLVATNDVHYINREDSEFHDVLLCIQTGAHVNDTDRMRFASDQFYLKSEKEMRRLFSDIPEAIENTHKIAERCSVDFDFEHRHLPQYDTPKEYESSSAYLRHLCEEGYRDRYGEGSPELRERMEYELGVIESMGFVDYFLVVWDFINYAKSRGIAVGPGRGSAAGSIVAYALRITDIDPIRYSLIFERFLNPERVSMPDIDVDFEDERRGEVIDYVVKKYGVDNVSQICTFGTMKAKAAIRDVGRVLEMGYAEVDRIAKMVPFALGMTLDRAMELNPELKSAYDEDRQIRRLIDLAKKIEGMPRNVSTHAAGVVISGKPLDEYVPLYKSDKGVSVQFNMTLVERLGLLKMDFLGLKTLTVIKDALRYIKQEHGVDIDFSSMEFDDPEVYRMIADGDTMGVFQLESEGMTQFMKNLAPDTFEDIIAGIALYRPGPMDSIPDYIRNKKNTNDIKYLDPHLEPILSVTYGCLIYQEQVMQIVRDLAGYSYGRSDLVRRAMSKKKESVMLQEQEYFIYGRPADDEGQAVPGCIANGIPEEAAREIFQVMVKFASYAFNKSHATAYAVVAYETAWLKKHYRAEFMAALMSSVMGDSAHVNRYINDCREAGIDVLPPDVYRSRKKFSVENGAIRFGLLAVKGVGAAVIDDIIRARTQSGMPHDFEDFVNELDMTKMNRKAMESLILAGAFDCIEENRAMLRVVYSTVMDAVHNRMKNNVVGQMSLFSDFGDQLNEAARSGGAAIKIGMPKIEPWDMTTKLSFEKEVLGVYVSGHPLDGVRDSIINIINCSSDQLAATALQHRDPVEETVGLAAANDGGYIPGMLSADDARRSMMQEQGPTDTFTDGQRVTMAGIITGVRNMVTKKNTLMAFVQLEDLYGTTEVIVFPKTFDEVRDRLAEDSIVVITGRLQFREEEDPKLIAGDVMTIEEYEALPICVVVPAGRDAVPVMNAVKESVERFPGKHPVYVKLEAERKWLRPEGTTDAGKGFRSALEPLVGSRNLSFAGRKKGRQQ